MSNAGLHTFMTGLYGNPRCDLRIAVVTNTRGGRVSGRWCRVLVGAKAHVSVFGDGFWGQCNQGVAVELRKQAWAKVWSRLAEPGLFVGETSRRYRVSASCNDKRSAPLRLIDTRCTVSSSVPRDQS